MKIMDGTKIRNFRMERRRKKKKKGKFPTFQLIRLITARSSNNFRSYYFHRFRTNCRQEQSVNFINSHFDRPISPNIYIYNTYFPLLECSCIYINSETRFTIRRSMLRDLCWIEHRTRIVTSNVSSFHRCSRRSLQADNEAVALPAERLWISRCSLRNASSDTPRSSSFHFPPVSKIGESTDLIFLRPTICTKFREFNSIILKNNIERKTKRGLPRKRKKIL